MTRSLSAFTATELNFKSEVRNDKIRARNLKSIIHIFLKITGMPHIHGVAWICPNYLKEKGISGYLCDMEEKDLVPIINKLITCQLPNENRMKKTVNEVQKHRHTQSCLKYNGLCRYGFPKLPSNATVIAEPSKEKDEKMKTNK